MNENGKQTNLQMHITYAHITYALSTQAVHKKTADTKTAYVDAAAHIVCKPDRQWLL